MALDRAAGYNPTRLIDMSDLFPFFRCQFDAIHKRSLDLLTRVPENRLFWKPPRVEPVGEPYSFGELLIRSAAAVEQAFGGITTRLWDDPFEWTLPEELADKNRIVEYLVEVETRAHNGFAFFTAETDLFREIPAPDTLKPIAEILLGTLVRASHLQGRACGVAQQFIRLRPHLP